MTFEEAASAPLAALTALQGLRDKGQIRPGHKVLIHGAGGGVGTFAVQIAKSFGADVTGVSRTGKTRVVQSIGADRAIDYTQQDFTAAGHRYDLIIDCFANHSLSTFRRVLNSSGIYVGVGGPGGIGILGRLIGMAVLSQFGRQKFVTFLAKPRIEDLAIIRDLLASGKIKPVIDRRYSLDEVPEAVRRLGEGPSGKIVITL